MLIFDTVVQNGMHIFFERVNCLQNFIYLLSHFSYRTNIRTRYKRYGNFRIQGATRYSTNLQVLVVQWLNYSTYTVLILCSFTTTKLSNLKSHPPVIPKCISKRGLFNIKHWVLLWLKKAHPRQRWPGRQLSFEIGGHSGR